MDLTELNEKLRTHYGRRPSKCLITAPNTTLVIGYAETRAVNVTAARMGAGTSLTAIIQDDPAIRPMCWVAAKQPPETGVLYEWTSAGNQKEMLVYATNDPDLANERHNSQKRQTALMSMITGARRLGLTFAQIVTITTSRRMIHVQLTLRVVEELLTVEGNTRNALSAALAMREEGGGRFAAFIATIDSPRIRLSPSTQRYMLKDAIRILRLL